jgi:hypothetical protein
MGERAGSVRVSGTLTCSKPYHEEAWFESVSSGPRMGIAIGDRIHQQTATIGRP